MIGTTTSARAGVISAGTSARESSVSSTLPGRRNFSGTEPAARRRLESAAGRKWPSGPTANGTTSYFEGSSAPTIVRAEMRETSRSTERPPKRTTTRRRLTCSPAHDPDVLDRGRAAQLLQGVPRRRGIHGDDRGRLRTVTPGEREVRDVDAGRAQERPDGPDDPGHVPVAQEDDRPLRPEFQRQVVHLDDPGVAPRKERRIGAGGAGADERDADRADVVSRKLVPRRDDRHASLLRHDHGVDEVDGLRGVSLQGPLDGRHRDRAKQVLRQPPRLDGDGRDLPGADGAEEVRS